MSVYLFMCSSVSTVSVILTHAFSMEQNTVSTHVATLPNIHHQFSHVVTVLWQGSDDVVTILSPTRGTSCRIQNLITQ